jgi:hypothetical protein
MATCVSYCSYQLLHVELCRQTTKIPFIWVAWGSVNVLCQQMHPPQLTKFSWGRCFPPGNQVFMTSPDSNSPVLWSNWLKRLPKRATIWVGKTCLSKTCAQCRFPIRWCTKAPPPPDSVAGQTDMHWITTELSLPIWEVYQSILISDLTPNKVSGWCVNKLGQNGGALFALDFIFWWFYWSRWENEKWASTTSVCTWTYNVGKCYQECGRSNQTVSILAHEGVLCDL